MGRQSTAQKNPVAQAPQENSARRDFFLADKPGEKPADERVINALAALKSAAAEGRESEIIEKYNAVEKIARERAAGDDAFNELLDIFIARLTDSMERQERLNLSAALLSFVDKKVEQREQAAIAVSFPEAESEC